ncbi:MAG: integrase, partial [Methylocystaceae bacterium]|nr:integrase [Methylocystaceae bacterium]
IYGKARVTTCLHTKTEMKAYRAADQLSAQLEGIWSQARLEKTLSNFRRTQGALVSPIKTEKRPEATVTLTDALDLYIRLKGKNKAKSFLVYTQRNISYVIECLGNAEIPDLGRAAASKFRDHLISKNLTTASIKRVFATVRAAINLAISEHGLACTNAFVGTFIPEVGEKKIRPPISSDGIIKIQNACYALDDDARWLIALISDTGMRLSEAVGLSVGDLKLDEQIPYIDLKPHPWRPLKTPKSNRQIPLVGASLWAACRTVRNAKSQFLFDRYTNSLATNSNSASAALNQWMRKRLPTGSVIHSFRHSMRDRLRAVECPSDIVDAIGGWATQGVGHAYGSGYPLEVLHRWLSQVVLAK